MFAIVDIAGTQERVEPGARLKVPTLAKEEGASVQFENVLLVSHNGDVQLGTPTVTGAAVKAKVLSHGRFEKIRVFKMRRRKRYRRVQGHRQGYTEIEVNDIVVKKQQPAKASADAAPASAQEEGQGSA